MTFMTFTAFHFDFRLVRCVGTAAEEEEEIDQKQHVHKKP